MTGQTCEFPNVDVKQDDAAVKRLLSETKKIAVVGMSTDPEKPAHIVPKYLKEHGYRIVPVHPKADKLLGEEVYHTLRGIPFPIDVVEIFRPAAEIPGIVEDAIQIGAKAVWMQKGLAHHQAAETAREAGIEVVQDRCMMEEHKRLLKS